MEEIQKLLKEKEEQEIKLLAAMTSRIGELMKLLEECNDRWMYDDAVYRFYHQSFKVYNIQEQTRKVFDTLQSLAPHLRLNNWFSEIVKEGTGKEFKDLDNLHWTSCTRPMLEAFFHARYFLEMICKYGATLKAHPQMMPSGWAAVLYLYNLR